MVFTGQVKSDFLKDIIVPLNKKPSLINYAATDFLSIRESLIDYVKAAYPLDFENFSESELGVMLIELVAYMGSVLSLKADILANENYLHTAKLRRNVKKLLELVGVRMKGPISAAANAQITWPWATGGPNPWSSGEADLTITPANRVLSMASPEDGAQMSFTLYKVLPSGRAELSNATGNLILTGAEAIGTTSGVHTNLVYLEGSLVSQTGTFTSAEATKTIVLANTPIVEGSIDVFIIGAPSTSGTYTQVENLFSASGATDKIFQIIQSDDFDATLVFGDNITGQSPAPADSYTVTYRVGGGSRGNIGKGFINASVLGTLGGEHAGTVTNVSVGTGGADAETVAHAKRYAPLTFKRQDRLVTLPDFESFANTYVSNYGSTGKATVSVRKAFSSANVIDVYVLEKASDFQLRRATPQYKESILSDMNAKKMLTDELVIVDGLIRTLDLVLTVRIDEENKRREPNILSLVRNQTLDYFSVDNREFGQDLIIQDLVRYLHDIDEIRFITVDNLVDNVMLEHNEIIQLNNLTINSKSV